jgi:SAM-dependent methyltransferase
MGFHPAALFRHLTDQLSIVVHDADVEADDEIAALVASGVEVVRAEVRRIVSGDDGRVTAVELADGRTLPADSVVVGPTFHARADILSGVGLAATPHESGMGDAIDVDATGQTSVAGLYAAGNVADPSVQVLQAAANGSLVGAMIAFDLAGEDLHGPTRVSGDQTDWDQRYGADHPVWSGNPNGTLVAEVTGMPNGRVLDVGAGEGGDAMWLAERGWTVTANDISGRGLSRVATEAERRGLSVECLHADANELGVFTAGGYDLVSMQYGSIRRTPDHRALKNLLGAVAPDGTLLVVGHDPTPLSTPIDVAEQTRMFDPDAYLGINDIATAISDNPQWELELHETRPRPPGAASAHHHVDDVILRARRRTP